MNYEEFKKYANEMKKNILNKLKDNEEELIFYIGLVKKINDICEENEELKKQVEEYRKTNEHLLDKKRFLKQENQLLKKQLEEANKKLYLCTPEIPQNIHGKYVSYVDLVNEMYELKKQQQEFIKYLEDEIKACKAVSDLLFNSNKEIKVYKEILTKYKEIIGVSNERKN